MVQNRISNDKFRQILFDELNKGTAGADLKTNFFQLLQANYSIDKTRALKLHDLYFPEWAKINIKSFENKTATLVGDSVKQGLKIKEERICEIEQEILSLKALITQGYIAKSITVNGDKIEKKEIFGVNEITRLHTAIDVKRSEISRLSGDYAPIKTENKNFDFSKAEIIF